MHTMQSIINIKDVEACADLMTEMTCNMTQDRYQKLLNGWEAFE